MDDTTSAHENILKRFIATFKLLLDDGRNPETDVSLLCRRIFGSTSSARAFIYLCQHGAATARTLCLRTGISEQSAYRALRTLHSLKAIEPIKTLNARARSGPRATVWGIVGCTHSSIKEAANLHFRHPIPELVIERNRGWG